MPDMNAFLVRIACRSPYLTPWRNCTLWGRFAWIVADGRLPGWNIDDWIDRTRHGRPPIVVGDAFPFDAVPVPAAFFAAAPGPEKRAKLLPWPDWLELCQNGSWPQSTPVANENAVQRMHVVIDRAAGTAVEGGLRTETGWFPSEEGLLFVALVDDDLGQKGLENLVEELCREGWGQGRSYGYGQIQSLSVQRFERPPAAPRSAALGHIHPTDDLPKDGLWRFVGVPVRRHDPQTRKAPLQEFVAMLMPGATFAVDRPWIGTCLDSPKIDNYLHYGLAPTWPLGGLRNE